MSKYEEVVNLALRRSLFYPSSEIYANSPAGFYNYGPYGASIRRKIVDVWRKELVQKEQMLEIDGAITMPSDVFKASGHLTSFNDPITKCKKCSATFRVDKLLTEITKKEYKEAMKEEDLTKALRDHKIKCQKCKGDLEDVKKSSLMVKADVGIAEKAPVYLRPETCQTIFTDFLRMTKTMRLKLPKGIAQIGKAFRNEISPRQTILRTIEFTQMEIELFFDENEINSIERFNEVKDYKISVQLAGKEKIEKISCEELVKKKIVSGRLIAYYLAITQQMYEKLGFSVDSIRFRQLDNEERAFYAKEGWDFEVQTSLGWTELIANNYRTDYDLKGHSNGSKQDLSYVDDQGKKVLPHVWEISIGLDRTFYAVLENSFKQEKDRKILSLPSLVAPIHAAIFPLLSNKEELVKKAKELFNQLQNYEVFYDDTGSIGKRYARMDEIGCPYCITIDFDSLEKDDVTIRERDSAAQKRVKIKDLNNVLYELITGRKKFSQV